MKKIEFKTIQSNFFNEITKEKSLNNRKEILTYRDLIYYRFNEVLTNVYPQTKLLLEDKWKSYILKFIESGSKTPLIWQMPKEFKNFLIEKKLVDKVIKELLWFEWIEIELYMAKDDFKNRKFSWNKKFKLSNKAIIKTLKYPIYKGDFKTKGNYKILIYENRDKNQILWLEITPFMFDFLKQFNRKKELKITLKKITQKNKLNYKDTKEIIENILMDFIKFGILI